MTHDTWFTDRTWKAVFQSLVIFMTPPPHARLVMINLLVSTVVVTISALRLLGAAHIKGVWYAMVA